jgi:predicted P-loop ATPase
MTDKKEKPGVVVKILDAPKGKTRKVHPPREGWQAQLTLNEKGKPTRSLANIGTVLSEHPEWQGVLAYDAFAEAVISLKPPPVRPQEKPVNHVAGEWTDTDDIRTAMWLGSAEGIGIDAGVQTVAQAVVATANKNIVHPVRKYLESLQWDAKQRLPTLFSNYFGSEQTPYTEAVGKMLMIACVARVMSPGCKVDTVWVLEGNQGIFKSTAVKTLVPDPLWFADSGIVLGDKDSFQNLRGIWIYELPELSGIKNARDVERFKAFFSSGTDTFRPSYGRRSGKVPRQCVFISTTNDEIYLLDKTGNRRFLPVKCGLINLEALKADRDQLWAEAIARWQSREVWWVQSKELTDLCREQQAEREQVDPWVQFVQDWVADGHVLLPNDNSDPDDRFNRVSVSDGLTTGELLRGAINFARERVDARAEMRMSGVMRTLGWERRQVRLKAEWRTREWRYFPPNVTNVTDQGENPVTL